MGSFDLVRDTNVTRDDENQRETTTNDNKRNALSEYRFVGTGRSPRGLLYFMLYYDI
jgi:hypothetical protein